MSNLLIESELLPRHSNLLMHVDMAFFMSAFRNSKLLTVDRIAFRLVDASDS